MCSRELVDNNSTHLTVQSLAIHMSHGCPSTVGLQPASAAITACSMDVGNNRTELSILVRRRERRTIATLNTRNIITFVPDSLDED